MANNPNVNKVVYGNQTVMDITDTTAEPENVLEGEVFYDRSGTRQTGTAIGGIPEEELRDTVGWTGKNLLNSVLESGTSGGITVDVNSDGSFHVYGTTSSDSGAIFYLNPDLRLYADDYIFSCEYTGTTDGSSPMLTQSLYAADGTRKSMDFAIVRATTPINTGTVEGTDYVGTFRIFIGASKTVDCVMRPMIRKASIKDSSFEPYHGTVDEVKADKSSLATVATTGSYNDLSNKPSIPAAQVNSDWNSSSGVSQILNKPTLATVATSGSYDDLINEPTVQSAVQYGDTRSLVTTGEKYTWNKGILWWYSGSALTGATSVTIEFNSNVVNGDVVALLADDGTGKPVKYKSISVDFGLYDEVTISFSALAHDTDFKIGMV